MDEHGERGTTVMWVMVLLFLCTSEIDLKALKAEGSSVPCMSEERKEKHLGQRSCTQTTGLCSPSDTGTSATIMLSSCRERRDVSMTTA